MLSSPSTQSKDPSLFPLCGSDPTATCGRPTTVASDREGADFGALFANLNPEEPTEDALVPDQGALVMPGLGLAFVPPPVALSPIPDLTAPGSGDEAEGDALSSGSTEGVGFCLEGSGMDPEWAGRGVENANRHYAQGKNDPTTCHPAEFSPAEEAAIHARQTPRFDGLPTAALEHRQAATLPPGLVRLQAQDAAPTPGGSDAGADANLVAPEAAAAAAERALRQDKPTAGAHSARTPMDEEKFAGRGEPAPAAVSAERKGGKKSFLESEEEVVVSQSKSIGIDGAKAGVNMSASHFNAPTTHPKFEYTMSSMSSVAAAGSAPGEVMRPAAVEELNDTFRTAHEAVEVVLHAVEHVASRAQKSVQLNFSVAGEELAVRVEMRADQVRTTFRTDSAELRAALAQEWQQVSASAPTDRPVRIAPAVFTSAEPSALNAFAGDTSSRGRHPGASRSEAEAALAGLRGRAVATTTHPVALPSVAAPVRTRGAHRLHTLA